MAATHADDVVYWRKRAQRLEEENDMLRRQLANQFQIIAELRGHGAAEGKSDDVEAVEETQDTACNGSEVSEAAMRRRSKSLGSVKARALPVPPTKRRLPRPPTRSTLPASAASPVTSSTATPTDGKGSKESLRPPCFGTNADSPVSPSLQAQHSHGKLKVASHRRGVTSLAPTPTNPTPRLEEVGRSISHSHVLTTKLRKLSVEDAQSMARARGSGKALDAAASPGPSKAHESSVCISISRTTTCGTGAKKATFYVMRVESKDQQWLIPRRYSQFHALYQSMQALTEQTLHFPPKKILGVHSASLIQERQDALQAFLWEILTIRECESSPRLWQFLDPLHEPSVLSLNYLRPAMWGPLHMMTEQSYHQRKWRTFWFVLSGDLFYFADREAASAQGVVPLDYCSIDAIPETLDNHRYCFHVTHLLASEPVYLAADSVDARRKWVEALRLAKSGRMHSSYSVALEDCDDSSGDVMSESDALPQAEGSRLLSKWLSRDGGNAGPDAVGAVSLKEGATTRLTRNAHRSHRWSTFYTLPDAVRCAHGTAAFAEPDDETNLVLDATSGRIARASIAKLVEVVTSDPKTDRPGGVSVEPELVERFLLTYRSVVPSDEFLSLLMARFHAQDVAPMATLSPMTGRVGNQQGRGLQVNPVQEQVCCVVKQWLELHFDVFAEDVSLTASLLRWVFQNLEGNFLLNSHAERIKAVVETKVARNKGDVVSEAVRASGGFVPSLPATQVVEDSSSQAMIPEPLLPAFFNETAFDFLDIDPLEMARQLTILEHDLFCCIQPRELLGQAWSKESKRHLVPNIMRVINRFNLTSSWVCTMVLRQNDLKARAALLSRLITIANHCRLLNNFETCTQITAGLTSTPVMRLRATWELIAPEQQHMFDAACLIVSPAKNHATYRAALAACAPPAIPYLGKILADLTFMEDGNPDTVDGMVNMDKWRMIADQIRGLRRWQAAPYALAPVPAIQAYLLRLQAVSEKECYELSLQLEPRKE